IAILNGSNAENARHIAEKIRNRIQKARFFFQEEEIPITVSLGVTEITPSDTEPENPFIRVDKAMYQAKKEGRNLVRVYREVFATGPHATVEGNVQEMARGLPLAVARTDLPQADFHSEESPY
ncbi:MAG: GGDEF domain-containing protein, partial [Syntrophobacteraceae bacterium]